MEEDLNNSNNQNSKKKFFSKIKSIHDYLNSKNKKQPNDDNINVIKTNFNDLKVEESNIYIKYLNNPNIIFQEKGDINNENLKLLFKELDSDIKAGINILFPFLDIFPNLIKAYIDSDLDDINLEEKESVSNSNYIKIFSQLKCNLFINKEILFPIYGYFSKLYDMVIEAQKIELKKLKKIIVLFKIFYDTNIINRNISSFCLIGGSLDIIFNKPFKISDLEIELEIRFLSYDFIEYLNDNFYIYKINENLFKYKEFKKISDNQRLESIIIKINKNGIYTRFNFHQKVFSLAHKVQLDEIETISLLEDFYGQITLIEISMTNGNKSVKYKYFPISIRNGNTIFHIKKIINDNKNISTEYTPKIKISDKNLVKVNYINYNNKIFNIINYFGGIIQFLPFHKIFMKLLQTPNISMNEANKFNKCEINDFINFIVKIMIKQLFSIQNNIDIYNKYILFVFALLLNIDFDINFSLDELVENDNQRNSKIYLYIELLIVIHFNQKNQSENLEKNIHEFLQNWCIKEKTDLNFFKPPLKKFNSLYRKYMKRLFCFNGFWSKRNIFFPKRYKDLNPISKQIKYKQINYYTKNFQLPFFCPILEYKNYFPNFSSFNIKLFKESDDKILNYDFRLEFNEKAKIIINALISKRKDDNNSEKCCLVKNTHHVKGELSIIKMGKKSNKNFKLYFKKKGQDNCNKVERVKILEGFKVNMKNSYPDEILCYGAIFNCPKRENSRRITINSSDILFLMIRVYFHSVSAIEIFTINKSYYFNFKNEIKKKTNKILNEFMNSPFFKEIKIEKDKIVIGYYNIKYKPYLFPLFEDKITNWKKKRIFLQL